MGYGHQHKPQLSRAQMWPGPDVFLVPGGKYTTNIIPFLSALISSELPFITAHEPFCLLFSPISPLYILADHIGTWHWHLHMDASGKLNCEDPGCPKGVFCLPESHDIRRPVDASGRLEHENPATLYI